MAIVVAIAKKDLVDAVFVVTCKLVGITKAWCCYGNIYIKVVIISFSYNNGVS